MPLIVWWRRTMVVHEGCKEEVAYCAGRPTRDRTLAGKEVPRYLIVQWEEVMAKGRSTHWG